MIELLNLKEFIQKKLLKKNFLNKKNKNVKLNLTELKNLLMVYEMKELVGQEMWLFLKVDLEL